MNPLQQVEGLIHRLFAFYYHTWGETHRYIGNLVGLRAEYRAAARCLTRAIAWNPELAQAYQDRGILYWRELGDPRQAICDLTKALDLAPELLEARLNRGIAHQQLREYAEAVADYRAYLAEADHLYWREYAESMVKELSEWITPESAAQ